MSRGYFPRTISLGDGELVSFSVSKSAVTSGVRRWQKMVISLIARLSIAACLVYVIIRSVASERIDYSFR